MFRTDSQDGAGFTIHVLGFPTRVTLGFFAMALILGASIVDEGDFHEIISLAIWVAAVSFSIAWHEVGHAVAMRAYRYQPTIALYAMGGLTRWGGGPVPTPRQRSPIRPTPTTQPAVRREQDGPSRHSRGWIEPSTRASTIPSSCSATRISIPSVTSTHTAQS